MTRAVEWRQRLATAESLVSLKGSNAYRWLLIGSAGADPITSVRTYGAAAYLSAMPA